METGAFVVVVGVRDGGARLALVLAARGSADKVLVTLEGAAVEVVRATSEAGVNDGPRAFGRPPTARLGKPRSSGEGLRGAALFAESNGSNREDVVAFPEPFGRGGGSRGRALRDELVCGFVLVATNLVFAGFAESTVLFDEPGPYSDGHALGALGGGVWRRVVMLALVIIGSWLIDGSIFVIPRPGDGSDGMVRILRGQRVAAWVTWGRGKRFAGQGMPGGCATLRVYHTPPFG